MKVSEAKLKHAILNLLKVMGSDEAEAQLVADVLVQADMRGIGTHGCAFIPLIAERQSAGLVNIPTRTRQVADDGATAVIDGQNGLGQPAAAGAMRLSIEKAKKYGVGMTLVRNTNHIGFLGYYTMMAAKDGMIGVCMTNAAPAIAPWGGAEAFFGTNPLSIAAPVSGGPDIVLDMSSSIVARGKIRRAQRMNEKIPGNWALDNTGKATTDPSEALKGSLLPLAGPKGYGLALFVDIFSGLLSGSKYGRELLTFHKPLGPTGVGATFMAIDVARFMPINQFEKLISEFADSIRNSKKANGNERIFLPGEIEAEKAIASRAEGIEIDNQIVDKINRLLEEKGISPRIGNRHHE